MVRENVAEESEVLSYFTEVMRGDGSGAMKAAELLGKHLGLFDGRTGAEESRAPVIVDDIG